MLDGSGLIAASAAVAVAVGVWYKCRCPSRKRVAPIEPVLPHGDIEALLTSDASQEGVWQLTGSLPYPLPRNMVVYRSADGGLLVHSAIAMNEDGFRALRALGDVRVVVVPSTYHTRDVELFRARFPSAFITCPADTRDALRHKGIEVHDTLEAAVASGKVRGVTLLTPQGMKDSFSEKVLALHVNGAPRVLVFCDLAFHLPSTSALVPRLLGSCGFFGVTRIGRWFMMADKRKAARFFAELAASEHPWEAISVAHGKAVRGGDACRAKLTEAADRLS